MATKTTPDDTRDTDPELAEPDQVPVHVAINRVARDVGAVGKDRRTGENGEPGPKYNYRGIDAVMNAVHPALIRHGVVIVPQVEHWATEDFNLYTKPNLLTQIKVRYLVVGPMGDSLEVVAIGEGVDNGDKGTGKAMSYAYKSAIGQLLSLPTDDPDMDNEHSDERAAAPPRASRGASRTRRSPTTTDPAPEAPTDDDPALRARMVAALADLDQEGRDEAASWLQSERRSLKAPVETETLARFGDYMALWLNVPAWPAPTEEEAPA